MARAIDRFFRLLWIVFGVSFACAIVALPFGAHSFGTYATYPALALSAWAFGGHLVTLDDDARGGWSNPEGSTAIWRESLRHLAIKFFVFLSVVVVYFLHNPHE